MRRLRSGEGKGLRGRWRREPGEPGLGCRMRRGDASGGKWRAGAGRRGRIWMHAGKRSGGAPLGEGRVAEREGDGGARCIKARQAGRPRAPAAAPLAASPASRRRAGTRAVCRRQALDNAPSAPRAPGGCASSAKLCGREKSPNHGAPQINDQDRSATQTRATRSNTPSSNRPTRTIAKALSRARAAPAAGRRFSAGHAGRGWVLGGGAGRKHSLRPNYRDQV